MDKYLEAIWNAITPEFIMKFAIVYFFIIWISLIVWVLKDIRNRSNNILFQVFCVLIPFVLTPFWIFIYLLVRPTRTLYEKFYAEVEDNLDIILEIVKERKKDLEDKIQKNIEKTDTEIKNIKQNMLKNLITKPITKPVNTKTNEKKDIKITKIKKKEF